MNNREGTIVSIITYTNNRFRCYAKKVCINLKNSMYACLICLSLFFINRLPKQLYFFRFIKVSWYISDNDNNFDNILPIALYVGMIAFVEYTI